MVFAKKGHGPGQDKGAGDFMVPGGTAKQSASPGAGRGLDAARAVSAVFSLISGPASLRIITYDD